MLSYFFVLYLVLARVCNFWNKKVQIHSIIHCVISFLWTTYVLFISTGYSFLNTNFRALLTNVTDRKFMFSMIIFHSLGYFLADTVDIFIDYKNQKRRVYLLHHVVAIAGLSTIYWGSYISVYPIWSLEIGGIVHHMKHVSEVYDINIVIYLLIQGLYHVIYLMSRILLALNVYTVFTWICHSDTIGADITAIVVAIVLIIQNLLWWVHNVKKIFVK